MIVGIGTDLVDIRRIEHAIERFGARFLTRLFTDEERNHGASRASKAAFFAKRFAAKEACVKALGTGFRDGIWFSDIGVLNDSQTGKPSLCLSNRALLHLNRQVPEGFSPLLHLSLTDDFPYAQAFVIFSLKKTKETLQNAANKA